MRGDQKELPNLPFGGPSAIIAAAAHELKTPLTVITYLTQNLADEHLNLSPQERATHLRRLELVSKRSLRLVQQLTISYRLEDNRQLALDFNLEPVNIREVCEAALHELTPYAYEYRQELRFKTAGRSHVAVANRDILYDVVVNLVDNAIRHNAPETPVTVQPFARGKRVRLAVHDNGAGIAPHQLRALRRNLGNAPQPLSGHAGTSGLGLYIVGQLAGAMGGTVGLGRARQGTTFFLDLIRSRQLSLW